MAETDLVFNPLERNMQRPVRMGVKFKGIVDDFVERGWALNVLPAVGNSLDVFYKLNPD